MNGTTSSEIRNETRAKPVGRCIYCDGTEKLTDEHVVPYGLGGRLILPEASCAKCTKITTSFERRVLRGFMHDARTAGRFPTYHPRKRPATVPIDIKKEGRFETVQLPSSESLGIVQLPNFERAAFLAGQIPVSGINVSGVQTIGFGKSPEEVASALVVKTLQVIIKVDVSAFVRMLAKIGYSFAVANLGPYPLAEVPVLPLIHGTADDGGTWVGSADYRLDIEDKKPQCALGLVYFSGTYWGVAENVIVAQVKLFADTGATGYEIVVRRTPV
jgi:hypothetical protein